MKADTFPRKSVLWNGAILGGIVYAIKTAQNTFYADLGCWDGNHYIMNALDGRLGAISFECGPSSAEGRLVGAFHFPESDRNPFHWKGHYVEWFFRGCPTYQRSLAEQVALPYLEMEVEGKVMPLVTAAFWDTGEYLAAAEPWEIVVANGANLIEENLMEDREAALHHFQMGCGMSAEQVGLARSLVERKLARPGEPIALTPAEVRLLESTFEDPKARYAQMHRLRTGEDTTDVKGKGEAIGASPKWWESLDSAAEAQKAMNECRDLFAGIGIVVPET